MGWYSYYMWQIFCNLVLNCLLTVFKIFFTAKKFLCKNFCGKVCLFVFCVYVLLFPVIPGK
jgi:hypothetical protein